MKLKTFNDDLSKISSLEDVERLKSLAESELKWVKGLQQDLANEIAAFMEREKVGFNEFVRKSGISASQLIRILRAEANMTLAGIAHLAALIGNEPHLLFGKSSQKASHPS